MAADMSADLVPEPTPAPIASMQPGRRRPIRWLALLAVVPALGLAVVLASRPPAATRTVRSQLFGKRAPEITGPTIEGTRIRLSDYRGRWVLVNFFATWCVPCRQEHPDLITFRERHQAIGDAEVLGVIYSDSIEAVRQFRAEHGGGWPMVADPDGRIALEFGVAGVPESFLISPDGTVVSKVVGGVRAADLENLLARAKNPPSSTTTRRNQ